MVKIISASSKRNPSLDQSQHFNWLPDMQMNRFCIHVYRLIDLYKTSDIDAASYRMIHGSAIFSDTNHLPGICNITVWFYANRKSSLKRQLSIGGWCIPAVSFCTSWQLSWPCLALRHKPRTDDQVECPKLIANEYMLQVVWSDLGRF